MRAWKSSSVPSVPPQNPTHRTRALLLPAPMLLVLRLSCSYFLPTFRARMILRIIYSELCIFTHPSAKHQPMGISPLLMETWGQCKTKRSFVGECRRFPPPGSTPGRATRDHLLALEPPKPCQEQAWPVSLAEGRPGIPRCPPR